MKEILKMSGASLAGIVTLNKIRPLEEVSCKVIEGVAYANLVYI